MSSLSNSGFKDKEKGFIIVKIAYSFLYLFSMAIFYLLWEAYKKDNVWDIGFYSGIYIAYLVLFVLVLRDIYRNYAFFEETNDKEGTALLENIHFLCADPLCSRCGGWYFGMALSLSLTFVFKDPLISFMQDYGSSEYFTLGVGILLFLISTPIQGSLPYLKKLQSSIFKSKKLKLILGLISGLSLTLIAVGILVILT